MENRPKPNKRPGCLFGASDSAGLISQNLINAQGISTERKTPVWIDIDESKSVEIS